jgi:heterodisulfide reductase subunit C/nitrate reductase gamma subunit
MFYTASLYVALLIFCVGCLYRLWTWFSLRIGDSAQGVGTARRIRDGLLGMLATLLSPRIFTLVREFLVNVLFQWKVLRESPLRWSLHMLIYLGFVFLFFLHAIDGTYSHPFFKEFYSTLDPYLFLRNLFGAMVILGVGLAIYRRAVTRRLRSLTSAMDIYAIAILAVIMVSGVLLEASKIVSYQSFERMLHEYVHPDLHISDHQKDPDLEALMALWQEDYGVVFPEKIATDPEKVAAGENINDEFMCSSCHSRPQSAFVSWGAAKVISPAANALTRAGAEVWLWYIHFLAAFIGLAYLPFSKFFHVFATPVSLLTNAVMKPAHASRSANTATRRAMELDACMHCATCSTHCSVGQIFKTMPNAAILPSEKLIDLKRLASGHARDAVHLQRISEGANICTHCGRCTELCPAGINLQDLWFCIREDLARRGYAEPFLQARETALRLRREEDALEPLVPSTMQGQEMRKELLLSAQSSNFSSCYKCTTCSSECPVVACHENPAQALGLLPHQVMHALALGLRDEALSSRMVWDCVTCYACQEACPQNVRVTDILYELRSIAYRAVKKGHDARNPASRGATDIA